MVVSHERKNINIEENILWDVQGSGCLSLNQVVKPELPVSLFLKRKYCSEIENVQDTLLPPSF
jgi:hypothetical protein